MSKPVQFSQVKFQPAVQRFEERAGKFTAYSAFGFMGTIVVGAVGATAAIATKGRFPSARFFNAWDKTMQVTGVSMFAGAAASSVAQAAQRRAPFTAEQTV